MNFLNSGKQDVVALKGPAGVFNELDKLQNSLDRLEETIDQLRGRLEPITVQAPPRPTTNLKEAVSPTHSSLEDVITKNSGRVDHLCGKVHNIIDSLRL